MSSTANGGDKNNCLQMCQPVNCYQNEPIGYWIESTDKVFKTGLIQKIHQFWASLAAKMSHRRFVCMPVIGFSKTSFYELECSPTTKLIARYQTKLIVFFESMILVLCH